MVADPQRSHHYQLELAWTGNRGTGTSGYSRYARDVEVRAARTEPIRGSSDPAFRGDPTRWNPEQLLVAALAQCHLLWYLHLAAEAGVIVIGYRDTPTGTMVESPGGGGEVTEVTLRPEVTVAEPAMAERAAALHARAHELCFIARSVRFPVRHLPCTRVADPGAGSEAVPTAGEAPPHREPDGPG